MAGALEAKKRINQMRVRQRQAGLQRVEVLVPRIHADAVKAYAAELREGSHSAQLKEIRKMLAGAYRSHPWVPGGHGQMVRNRLFDANAEAR